MIPSASTSRAGRPPEPWQCEFFSHLPEYGAELAGTLFLLFCVVGTVAWMFAPHTAPAHAIPSVPERLFLTGLILGGVGSLVAITPLGRLSGAHLNPAVSLSFFAEGKMKAHDLVAYTVAQCLGAMAGAWVAAEAFGGAATAVQDALTQPGSNVSSAWATAAEFLCVLALTGVILWMLSVHSLMRWTPVGAMLVVALEVLLDGHFSGASLNPARSLGPALVAGEWHVFWVYLAGPAAGGLLAGLLRRFAQRRHAQTGKVFHDPRYRSIFAGEKDHEANARLRREAGRGDEERPPLRSHRRAA